MTPPCETTHLMCFLRFLISEKYANLPLSFNLPWPGAPPAEGPLVVNLLSALSMSPCKIQNTPTALLCNAMQTCRFYSVVVHIWHNKIPTNKLIRKYCIMSKTRI